VAAADPTSPRPAGRTARGPRRRTMPSRRRSPAPERPRRGGRSAAMAVRRMHGPRSVASADHASVAGPCGRASVAQPHRGLRSSTAAVPPRHHRPIRPSPAAPNHRKHSNRGRPKRPSASMNAVRATRNAAAWLRNPEEKRPGNGPRGGVGGQSVASPQQCPQNTLRNGRNRRFAIEAEAAVGMFGPTGAVRSSACPRAVRHPRKQDPNRFEQRSQPSRSPPVSGVLESDRCQDEKMEIKS
jgi:hypothetical protein